MEGGARPLRIYSDRVGEKGSRIESQSWVAGIYGSFGIAVPISGATLPLSVLVALAANEHWNGRLPVPRTQS